MLQNTEIPQNIEAEQSVLCAMMIDNSVIGSVTARLQPTDFYRQTHRIVFQAMMNLYSRNKPVDLITLTAELKHMDQFDAVGGVKFITFLANITPTAVNVEHHAGLVEEASVRRRILETGNGLAAMSCDDTVDTRSLAASARQELERLSSGKRSAGFVSVHDMMTDTMDRMGRRLENGEPVTGLSTGYGDLDRLTGGLQPSDFIILAARPSMGKTALALNITANVALRGAKEGDAPKRVAFYSMEMSRSQLLQRMICTEADVDNDELCPGPDTTGEEQMEVMNRIWPASDKIAGACIYINDTPGLSILEVRDSARQLKNEGGLDLIVIDYLQLMQAPGVRRNVTTNRQYEVSEISRGLKAMARELNVPVLALSQLSRSVELRQVKRPILSDLRESGSLEQDADIVMFLYRENYYKNEEPSRITELNVAKHRNGPTGNMRKIIYADTTEVHFTEEESIDYGKHLIQQRDEESGLPPSAPLPDRAYEIIGMTGIGYFGHTTLLFFKAWEKSGFDNPVYLRYKNNQLEECTWQQALHTPEYRNHRILLFGEISDVNNENGDMIYEEVCPELTIIDKK